MDVDQYFKGWLDAWSDVEHVEPKSEDYTRGFQAFHQRQVVMAEHKLILKSLGLING